MYNRYKLNFDKVKLMGISIHHDDKYNTCGSVWYLSVTYECENETGIYEVVLPQIGLPIPGDRLPRIDIMEEMHSFNRYVDIELYDGVTLHPLNASKEFIVCKEVETKVHKMTLQEIEEKLGHKVEVVNEK